MPKTRRQGFDSFFLLMGWMLWKERNARTFNGVAMNVVQLADAVEVEATQWCSAGNNSLGMLYRSCSAF
jgi:hypothetical protein